MLLVKPYFIREPANATVMLGDTIRFDCFLGGEPSPMAIWRRDNGKMPIGRARIFDDKSLEISNVVANDEGIYICEAENVIGRISAKASLTVHCS